MEKWTENAYLHIDSTLREWYSLKGGVKDRRRLGVVEQLGRDS